MTESYDVAQQPTRRMGMGLPIGLAAAGAAGGYFLQPKAGMSAEEISKLFEANDTVEIKNKLKNSSEEAINEAKKLQQDLKEAEAKFAEAQKAKLPDTADEAKALQKAKDALKAEIDRLQGIENSKGGTVGGKFWARKDFLDPADSLYDLKPSEQKDLRKLLTKLGDAETGAASMTATERTALEDLLKFEKGKAPAGKLADFYKDTILNESALSGLSSEDLEKKIRDLSADAKRWDSATGEYVYSKPYKEARKIVAEYYKKNRPIPASHNVLNYEQAKGLSSFRVLGRGDKAAEGEIIRLGKDSSGKSVRFVYSEADGKQFVQDEIKAVQDLVESGTTEIFDKSGEAMRIRHQLNTTNLYNELSNYQSNGIIDSALADKAKFMTSAGDKLDIAGIMSQESAMDGMKTHISNLTQTYKNDKAAIEALKKQKFDITKAQNAITTPGIDISSCKSYDDVIEAIGKARGEVKITGTCGMSGVTTSMTVKEVNEIIDARKGIIKQVNGEKKRLTNELKQIMKDNTVFTDATEKLHEKEAGCTKLSEIRQQILDKFPNLRNKKGGKTLAEAAEVTSGTGKTITESDVAKTFTDAVADKQKLYDAAASKSGVVDETARKAAETNRDAIKSKFQTAVEKIGSDTKVGKWFGGHKWVAAAIGAAVLFFIGLGIRNSKNKENA